MFDRKPKHASELADNVSEGSLQVCKFSFTYQACIWPSSGPFCQQNPYSGWNCGIYQVDVVEYTFFKLCSNAEQIF